MKNVGLVGCGQMGSNHARIIAEHPTATLTSLYDVEPAKSKSVSYAYGGQATDSLADLVDCDAVVVSSSTDTHHDIVRFLLENSIDVLVEKPITTSVDSARSLGLLAEERGLLLMVGFVERSNPCLAPIFDLADDLIALHVVRHSPPPGRRMSDVASDLLIHDLDIVNQIVCKKDSPEPYVLQTNFKNNQEFVDVIGAAGGLSFNLSASRRSQIKKRTVVGSTEDLVVEIDLLLRTAKAFKRRSPASDMVSPVYNATEEVSILPVQGPEPLFTQFGSFISACENDALRANRLETQTRDIVSIMELLEMAKGSG